MLNLKMMGVMALVLGLSVVAAQAGVIYSLDEIPNTLDGWTTYDLTVDVDADWDWLGTFIDVQLTSGEIYVDPGVGFSPEPVRYFPPNAYQILGAPSVAFTTHVGAPPMAGGPPFTPIEHIILPAAPSVAAFSVDPAAGLFQMECYDSVVRINEPFRALRLTVTEGAIGTIIARTDYDPTPDGSMVGDKEAGEDTPLNVPPGTVVWEGPPAKDLIDGVYPDGIQEAAWNIPENADHGRWNNPNRMIVLSLAGPPGGPITGAQWDFGGTLVKSGVTVSVTLAELFGAGWENNAWPQGFTGMVDILMTQQDGATDSSTLAIFVPEPGTMALLGFGCLATLLRRRRK